MEGKSGSALSASVLSGFVSGAISGFAADILPTTGGSAAVVAGVMAIAGAVGSVAGNVVEARETGKEIAPKEIVSDALWDAGVGAVFGYLGGEIASGISTIEEYGFTSFATQMFDKELTSFASNFAQEIASNWGSSISRFSIELYKNIFMNTLN